MQEDGGYFNEEQVQENDAIQTSLGRRIEW